MNYKILLLIILSSYPLAAMDQTDQQKIRLMGADGTQFHMPKTVAVKVPLIKRIIESNTREAQESSINFPAVKSHHLRILVEMLNTETAFSNMRGLALKKFLERRFPLKTEQALALLEDAHYLEYKPLLEYAVYRLVKQNKADIPSISVQFGRFDKGEFHGKQYQQYENIKEELRRQYYLVYHENLDFRNSTHFSIKELMEVGKSLQEVLTSLEMRFNSLEGFAESAMENKHISDRSTLSFLDNELTSLSPAQFALCHSLQYLNLSHNELEDLPEDAFAGLDHLQELHLADNSIRSLPCGLLRPLTALTSLDLRYNQIYSFDTHALGALRKLITLNLAKNPLGTLPENSFDSNTLLEEIDLHGCKLSYLPRRLITRLTSLKRLNLAENDLNLDKQLPSLSEAFFHIKRVLTTSDKQLPSLSEEFFHNNHALTTLDLSCNKLITIPEGLLAKLTALKTLTAENSRLKSVHAKAFVNNTHLQELNLESNFLLPLPSSAFAALKNLEQLSLSYNGPKSAFGLSVVSPRLANSFYLLDGDNQTTFKKSVEEIRKALPNARVSGGCD